MNDSMVVKDNLGDKPFGSRRNIVGDGDTGCVLSDGMVDERTMFEVGCCNVLCGGKDCWIIKFNSILLTWVKIFKAFLHEEWKLTEVRKGGKCVEISKDGR